MAAAFTPFSPTWTEREVTVLRQFAHGRHHSTIPAEQWNFFCEHELPRRTVQAAIKKWSTLRAADQAAGREFSPFDDGTNFSPFHSDEAKPWTEDDDNVIRRTLCDPQPPGETVTFDSIARVYFKGRRTALELKRRFFELKLEAPVLGSQRPSSVENQELPEQPPRQSSSSRGASVAPVRAGSTSSSAPTRRLSRFARAVRESTAGRQDSVARGLRSSTRDLTEGHEQPRNSIEPTELEKLEEDPLVVSRAQSFQPGVPESTAGRQSEGSLSSDVLDSARDSPEARSPPPHSNEPDEPEGPKTQTLPRFTRPPSSSLSRAPSIELAGTRTPSVAAPTRSPTPMPTRSPTPEPPSVSPASTSSIEELLAMMKEPAKTPPAPPPPEESETLPSPPRATADMALLDDSDMFEDTLDPARSNYGITPSFQSSLSTLGSAFNSFCKEVDVKAKGRVAELISRLAGELDDWELERKVQNAEKFSGKFKRERELIESEALERKVRQRRELVEHVEALPFD